MICRPRHCIPALLLIANTLSQAQSPPSTLRINFDQATLHHGGSVLVPVLDNDYDSKSKIDGKSLALEEEPKSGSAVIDGRGRILYTHRTGTPPNDSFKYRVSNMEGVVGTATVKVYFTKELRLVNATLNVPADPPGTAYQLVNALPGAAFQEPTGLDSPPGDRKRLFVLEKGGVVKMVPDVTEGAPSTSVFLDLNPQLAARGEKISTENEQGLLGITFHPRFADNGLFYLFYSMIKPDRTRYERVSCFTAKAGKADPESERVLIEQMDEAPNHQGSCLRFGPDGYLYVSLGDEGGQNDQFDNTQRIDNDFFSAIMRLDVDKKPGSLPPNPHPSVPTDNGVARFSVPRDNPYVHQQFGGDWDGVYDGAPVSDLTKVRTEFWATGFRNPWQMTFDPATGDLWEGDVGGGTREEINIVTRGGNYGWPYREGFVAGPKKPRPQETDFRPIDPISDYPHGTGAGQGNSLSGGLIYHGKRLPALEGCYIFADYASGNVWTLRRKNAGPPSVTRIAGESGITAFGTDPSNGDLLVTDYNDKRLLRLVAGKPGSGFPQKLSDTRLFNTTAGLTPSPGLLPYSINHPGWHDGAVSSHWFTIPTTAGQIAWSEDQPWKFPAGMIWVQQLDLETAPGHPDTARRIETRVLVKNDAGAYGVTYRWDDDQQDATLVPDAGSDTDLTITGEASPRRWHFPSQAECAMCHNPQAGYALSFNTRQLNHDGGLNRIPGNVLDLLRDHKFFANDAKPPAPATALPVFVSLADVKASLEERSRSYLAVNCSTCHQPGGLSPTTWNFHPDIPLASTGYLHAPAINNLGDPSWRIVEPGDPEHSLLLARISSAKGFTRMPLVGGTHTDEAAVEMLTDWIRKMPAK